MCLIAGEEPDSDSGTGAVGSKFVCRVQSRAVAQYFYQTLEEPGSWRSALWLYANQTALWYLLHCPNFMTIMFSSLVGAFFGHCEIFAIVRSSSIAVTGLGLCMLRPAPGRVSGFTTSTIVQLCPFPDPSIKLLVAGHHLARKLHLHSKNFIIINCSVTIMNYTQMDKLPWLDCKL